LLPGSLWIIRRSSPRPLRDGGNQPKSENPGACFKEEMIKVCKAYMIEEIARYSRLQETPGMLVASSRVESVVAPT
jgi:hypothetical protein